MSELYPNAGAGEDSLRAMRDFVNRIKTELKSEILKSAYPVGSLYFNYTNASNPSDLLGFGTWEKIETFVLGASASHPAGEVGGEETHTLTTDEMPSHNHTENSAGSHTHGGSTGSGGSHSHSRGTMNITGELSASRFGIWYSGTYASSGAFEIQEGRSNGGADLDRSSTAITIGFDASRSGAWTGSTSSTGEHSHSLTNISSAGSHSHTISNAGGGNAHNNMPPYTSVYIWKRTA